jgi:hypothetical protein
MLCQLNLPSLTGAAGYLGWALDILEHEEVEDV